LIHLARNRSLSRGRAVDPAHHLSLCLLILESALLRRSGGPKDLRRAFEKELLGQLWEGKVNAAIELLKGALEWVRNPAAVEELIAYLEKRRAYIPNYQQRQRAGLWIASTRVEKYNDWTVSARCKHHGMSWSPQGVLALAALEAARRSGELDAWRRDRALPERALPGPIGKAA
jgi:hypothetical protein